MRGLSIKVLGLTLLITTAGLANSVRDDETLKQLSRYREWPRVNKNPLPISNPLFTG